MVFLRIGLLLKKWLRSFSSRSGSLKRSVGRGLVLRYLASWYGCVASCVEGSRLLLQRVPRFVAMSCERRCSRAVAIALRLRSFLIAASSFFLPRGMMVGSV